MYKKLIRYIKNKFFSFYNLYLVKKLGPSKVADFTTFFNRMKENSHDEDSVVFFNDNFKLLCSNNDLHAVAETCITEDYQKYKSLKILPDQIVFDVGAHIGSFSIYAASKGALVYAFEPDPKSYAKLLKNINLNSFQNKITAFNFGIYSFTGQINLDTTASNNAGHSILTKNNKDKQKINIKKLSEVLYELNVPCVDLLKIDIEGAEYNIFKNLSDKEAKLIRKIVGEYHILPSYPEYNFDFLKKTLSPHYKNIKKYWPYNFYAIK